MLFKLHKQKSKEKKTGITKEVRKEGRMGE